MTWRRMGNGGIVPCFLNLGSSWMWVWVLKESIIQRFSVFERKIVRKIFGPSKDDNGIGRIKTSKELDELINHRKIINYAEAQRFSWFGHKNRMPKTSIVREIYVLTPWCRVFLEKLTGLQIVKKFPEFHGTRRFITALTSVRHLSLSWASPIQFIYPHPMSWRSILILSTHLRLGLPSGLFPSGFPTKTLYTPLWNIELKTSYNSKNVKVQVPMGRRRQEWTEKDETLKWAEQVQVRPKWKGIVEKAKILPDL